MPGAGRLSRSDVLQSLLLAQQADQRWLAAICAAPAVVLQTAGYLTGRKATSHPAFVDKLCDTRCILPVVAMLNPLASQRTVCLNYAISVAGVYDPVLRAVPPSRESFSTGTS